MGNISPGKTTRVVIVGIELAGLACALDLAFRPDLYSTAD